MSGSELRDGLPSSNEMNRKSYSRVKDQMDPDSNLLTSQSVETISFPLNKDFRHKIWQLLTFFRRVFIYFVVITLVYYERLDLPSWGRLVFKCLPVFTLNVFIYHQFNSLYYLQRHHYSVMIFVGMALSCLGDAFLVYQNSHEGFFLGGLVSFLFAHVFYTIAFGWYPFKSRMMLRSIIVSGLFYYYLYTGKLQSSSIQLKLGVAVYASAIITMQWRAWARISYQDIVEGRIYRICGALGASFFGLSDSILAINKFVFPVPGAYYSIMASYYLGQMLIALSVIDGPKKHLPQDGAKAVDEDDNFKVLDDDQSLPTKIVRWLIS